MQCCNVGSTALICLNTDRCQVDNNGQSLCVSLSHNGNDEGVCNEPDTGNCFEKIFKDRANNGDRKRDALPAICYNTKTEKCCASLDGNQIIKCNAEEECNEGETTVSCDPTSTYADTSIKLSATISMVVFSIITAML